MEILLIRFSSLGDVILASAVVEALHREHPGHSIHVLTKKAYADVFAADDRISRVIGIKGGEAPWKIVGMLGERRFGAIIDLHRTLRSISVSSLLQSQLKTTVAKHALARRLMVLSRNWYRRSFDVLDSYLAAARPLGVKERILPRIIPVPAMVQVAEHKLADLRGAGRLIGLAPGARHETKRWDAASFAVLADALGEQGHTPIFLGDTNDRQMIDTIRAAMQTEMHSVAGTMNLAGTIGMVSLLDAMVTNDSGPMHIAGALDVPFVSLFGPTHPDLGFCPGYVRGRILTTNEPCSPCSLHGAKPCRFAHRRCMEGITPRQVLGYLEEMLQY